MWSAWLIMYLCNKYFFIPQTIDQRKHFDCRLVMMLYPLFLLLCGVAFEYSGFDIWWISNFYNPETHLWPFKHHWLFDTVIHTWGQNFSKGMVLVWLILFILTFSQKDRKKNRKILFYFLIATAASPCLVGVSKGLTHIYTPWELMIFQGNQPYIRLLDYVPTGAPVGHAFPSGHASGGYAFVSLYFVLFHFRSSRRGYGLLFGLCLGFIFGLGQQIRGAHFPSHDLFSLAVCWYAALTAYVIFYPKQWRELKRW